MIINEKLIQLRKEKGLSQEQLAEKLDISRQAVSKWETGESLPDISKLILLSNIFGVSIDNLCGIDTANTDVKPPTTKTKPSLLIAISITLIIGLLIGMTCGYFLHASFDVQYKKQLDELKITNFSYYSKHIDKSFSSRTIQLIFTTNISNPTLKYSVIKTDSNGNSIPYDIDYYNGVCKCEVNLDFYKSYTLTAIVSDDDNAYSVGLIKFDFVSEDSLTYEELWKD